MQRETTLVPGGAHPLFTDVYVSKAEGLVVIGGDHSATDQHRWLDTLLTAALRHSSDGEAVAPTVNRSRLHLLDAAAEAGSVSAAHIKVQGAGALAVGAAASIVVL